MSNLKLAYKYARAFLNLYKDKIDKNQFIFLLHFLDFVKHNGVYFFCLSYLNCEKKNAILDEIIKTFNLIDSYKNLIEILIYKNRTFLLKDILKSIAWEYQEEAKKYYFDFYFSSEISEDKIKILKNYLDKKIGADIIYNVEQDSSLIAGVRAQSDYYLWQNSVAKNLKDIKTVVKQELNESK